VATFGNLVINGTAGGGYALRFTSGVLVVNSAGFSLTVGAPASIVITTQPSGNADDEEPFDRPPVVEVRDSGGNLVSGVTVTAVLVPQGLSAGTFICCDTAVTGANGRATFTGIGINRTGVLGDDYRIRFTIGALQSALSNNIDID
jgi:hypothetical protein